jgi:multicomponent Na+:H+ antiporter subunit E
VIKVDATHHTEVGRVTYANSITLTPGTISLDVSAETIEVHALTEDAANDLMSGEMARRVQRAEGA